MDKTIICMVGLSNSGKTTRAWAMWQELINLGETTFIVNRDACRLTLHGERYLARYEGDINIIEEFMVKAAFLYGYSTVIIDACHHTKNRRMRWAKIAQENGWDLRFKVLPTSPEECLRRAREKGDDYIIPVIERQSREADFWEDCHD